MTKSNIFLERTKKIQQELKAEKLGALLIESPVDLFYLTGMQMSFGYLFIKQSTVCLFVDKRYLEAAQSQSAHPAEEMGPKNEKAFLKGVKTMAFDGDRITYSHFLKLRRLVRELKCKLVSKPDIVKQLRLIKDAKEIWKMKESAALAYKAYQFIRDRIKPGMTEKEALRDLQLYCLTSGSEGMSFPPIIAFGKNTALPHHYPSDTKCKENDILLFDLGVWLHGYASDMTRVDFIGRPDPKLLHLYEVNKAAQRNALSKCRPGVKLKELDLAAREVMAKAGLEEYFVHSLGHGVGLEVHESPRIKFDGVDRNIELAPGMVITIEPGLYLPGKGGVRYEDTIVITERGYTNLYPE